MRKAIFGFALALVLMTAAVRSQQGNYSGSQPFTSRHVATINDAATISWNLNGDGKSNARVTLNHSTGASRTLSLSNMVDGGIYDLYFVQDGTGGVSSITFGAGCSLAWVQGGNGSTASTKTWSVTNTGASARALLTIRYDATDGTCYGFTGQ